MGGDASEVDELAVQSGLSDERFWALCDECRPKAMILARHWTRSAQDAEDLVQRTILRSFRSVNQFSPNRPFKNWFLRIMQRIYLDDLRRRKHRPVLFSLDALPDSNENRLEPGIGFKDPFELVRDAETAKWITTLCGRLPTALAEALLGTAQSEDSLTEFAFRLGVTPSTLRKRLLKARILMRREWIAEAGPDYQQVSR